MCLEVAWRGVSSGTVAAVAAAGPCIELVEDCRAQLDRLKCDGADLVVKVPLERLRWKRGVAAREALV